MTIEYTNQHNTINTQSSWVDKKNSKPCTTINLATMFSDTEVIEDASKFSLPDSYAKKKYPWLNI